MNQPLQSAATRIEERAARYLARRHEPQWTAQDQAELDAWLKESTAHEVAYLRLEYGWQKTDRLAALRGASLAEDINPASRIAASARSGAQPLRASRGRSSFLWSGAAAAAVMLVCLGAWRGGLFDAVRYAHYETEIGGHQTVPLADGSRIELNTNTQVRADFGDKARTVWVDRGEAYFDIAPDPARPFVVYAGERRVTVLGTKFAVRRDAGRVLVAVTEGRVQLETTAATEPPKIMKGGDKAIVERTSTRIESVTAERVARELSWRQGMLSFDQTTLAAAAEEFNRYNRKKLRVTDTSAQVRIGGSFEAANLGAFVRLLQQGFGLRASDDGEEIRISR